ncbi:TPA: hypothetical protein QDC44_001937 [Burkholderia cepacia ATCC 25416]|nr:hypothetical protein [Burkholderia cepacia ATCC 25416]
MSRKSSRSAGRRPLTKEMLLPLPLAKTRALSLEHHVALATIAQGHGNVDLMACLLKAVYTAFYLREETLAGSDDGAFRSAEAVLAQCVSQAERGEAWGVSGQDKSTLERILLLHDEQLASVPRHRYFAAIEKLHHFALGGQLSPISPMPEPER